MAELGGKVVSPVTQYILSFRWLKGVSCYAAVFLFSSALCAALLWSLPSSEATFRAPLRLPKSLGELHTLQSHMKAYHDSYSLEVLAVLTACQVFLVMFMVPGGIFLTLLVGSIYPFPVAMAYAIGSSVVGASLCYLLSSLFLRDIVHGLFPDRCASFSVRVLRHRRHLTNYLLFLRLTPLLPNWFINIAAPVVGIPYREFFLGSLVGQAPANILTAKAGQTIADLHSLKDLYSFQAIAVISGFAMLSILPVCLKRGDSEHPAEGAQLDTGYKGK